MSARSLLSKAVLKRISPAVVQVIALHPGKPGNLDAAWSSSGTLVHPQGYILTSYQVTDPRRVGAKALPAGSLAIASCRQADQPPVLTFEAEVAAQAPELNLALLRITRRLDGKKLPKSFPCLPLGQAEILEAGAAVAVLGYPGIGTDVLSLAVGKLTGFGQERDVTAGRAWLKTDLTLAGGYSGGAAVNAQGELIGIPVHSLSGARSKAEAPQRLLDTNLDGRLDERDVPLLVGGFIKNLRPVELAKALLAQAGVAPAEGQGSEKPPASPAPKQEQPTNPPTAVPTSKPPPAPAKTPCFTNLVFCEQVDEQGLPVAPAAVLKGGRKELLASFEFSGMKKGLLWRQLWTVDGVKLHEQSEGWLSGSRGRKTLALRTRAALPDGRYRLQLSVAGQELIAGEVIVGRPQNEADSEVSGQLLDQTTLRGIPQAMVLVLKPEVKLQDFLSQPRKEKTLAIARTDSNGRFKFPVQIPKGHAYSLIVVARGYADLAIEGALRLAADAPEKVQIYPLQLVPE